MVEVFALNIADTYGMNELSKFISPEKQHRIKAIKHLPSAQQVLASDLLARSVISHKLELENSSIKFSYNEYGKPAVNFKNFHFNLSHSGDWVVMAVSANPVGIDIEQITSIDLSVAEHVFSAEEYRQLKNLPESEQHDYFFDIWTLKESYIKMTGQGLSSALQEISIKPGRGNEHPELSGKLQDKCYFRQYDMESPYKMAVCAWENLFQPQVTKIDRKFLINLNS